MNAADHDDRSDHRHDPHDGHGHTSSQADGGLDAHFVVDRGDFRLDIALRLQPGTTTALLGPNGSGKSTTIDALTGLVPIRSGSIDLDGRTLDAPDRRIFVEPHQRGLGVVFQRYLLFDHLDVRDNVAFGPMARGAKRAEARRSAEVWIDTVGLSDHARKRPGELSGGQAQRVALARALASEPEALLLDEPLAALDVSTKSELRRALARHLAGFSGPRLLITHDPTDAFLLADQIIVLERGRVTQLGTPEQLRRRPATAYAASLAGLNLLTGVNETGSLVLDDHPLSLQCADTHTNGRVLITIHPNSVALHATHPHGSPRNTWSTTVDAVEPLGEITRVLLAAPLPLSVDVTPAAVESLGLARGSEVWASVKATEIDVVAG